MDIAKLNDWLQVIGIFAVVASLLFVGLQMKQAQEIAMSESFQARTDTTVDFFTELSQHEASIAVMAKQMKGIPDEITLEEKISVSVFFQGGMYLWENSYYQFVNGFLPRDHWERTRNRIKATLKEPLQMEIVTTSLGNYRSEFRAEIEKIIREVQEN